MFKKIWKKIKKAYIWMVSREVGEAINNGATYEEVERIVEDLAK